MRNWYHASVGQFSPLGCSGLYVYHHV